jgi:uncharacterized spore protein YtfJ
MLTDVIKAALDQIQTIAKTETIIGEPIVVGSVTLIPVSRVSIGFAAGGGGKDTKTNSGAGTGGGVTITPIAFISIINDRVQVLPVEKNDPGLGKILAMAPDIISKISKFMGKDKDSAHK